MVNCDVQNISCMTLIIYKHSVNSYITLHSSLFGGSGVSFTERWIVLLADSESYQENTN